MNIDSPLVSIIIPTYNRSQMLLKAISSALKQSYTNIEILVIDDASKDNTYETILSLNDKRIKYIRNETNKGPSYCKNVGVKCSSGKLINFLDDDDMLDDQKIELQVNKLFCVSEKIGAVYCGYRTVFEGKIQRIRAPKHRGNTFAICLQYNLSQTGAFLIKKDCFNKFGMFDEKMKFAEDWDFLIRLSENFELDFIPDILVTYNLHKNDQLSNNLKNAINGKELLIKKHINSLYKFKSILSYHHLRLGGLYLLNDQTNEGRDHILKSINLWPLNWKAYIFIFIIFGQF